MSTVEFKNKFNIGDKVCSYDFEINEGKVIAIKTHFATFTYDEIECYVYDILFVNNFGCNQVEKISEQWIEFI